MYLLYALHALENKMHLEQRFEPMTLGMKKTYAYASSVT